MSSFDDYDQAEQMKRVKAAEHPQPPKRPTCDPHSHKPPEPIYVEKIIEKGPEFMSDTRANIISMWIVIFLLFIATLFLVWNHFDDGTEYKGDDSPSLSEQAKQVSNSVGQGFKDAVVESFSFIHAEIRDIKSRIDALEVKSHSPAPKTLVKKVKRVRKTKTQVISSAEKLRLQISARNNELAYREKVWRIFYNAPIRPGESRSHCFGEDCRVIHGVEKQYKRARLRTRGML